MKRRGRVNKAGSASLPVLLTQFLAFHMCATETYTSTALQPFWHYWPFNITELALIWIRPPIYSVSRLHVVTWQQVREFASNDNLRARRIAMNIPICATLNTVIRSFLGFPKHTCPFSGFEYFRISLGTCSKPLALILSVSTCTSQVLASAASLLVETACSTSE